MKIEERKVVSFHYTLTGETGEQLESSHEGDPLSYLHGAGNIIAGLENAMSGKQVGDRFEVTLAPAEAYGERSEDRLQRIPAKHFKNSSALKPGQMLVLETRQGPVQVQVVKIGRFNIDVDANHPLAGRTLTFEVEVTDVRDATTEEISHRHVHGPGGVDH